MEELSKKGIRITLAAEEFIKEHNIPLEKILSLNKSFIEKDDLRGLEKEEKEKKKEVEIKRESKFKPIAKEYDADIKIYHALDVTEKSRTNGSVEDFISYFRNRYKRLKRKLGTENSKWSLCDVAETRNMKGEKVRLDVLVFNISITKNNNLLITIEDMTGMGKVVFTKRKEEIFNKAKLISKDDVVSIYCSVGDGILFGEDIEWVDIPATREKKFAENDFVALYLSDLHFGSKQFLPNYLDQLVEWIHGKKGGEETASKVKYMMVAGDLVDGIGIYPSQEKDLLVKDINKQYELFNEFLERLPDYIEVIIGPGNHDAVRRADPMPALSKELVTFDAHLVGSPSFFSIEGIKHLMYHGTSADSWIATFSHLSYSEPEKVMVDALKKRHLSPLYGGNPIVPERIDYMMIEEVPDVLHFGHVHKNGYAKYKNTLVINSGTFQGITDFQKKQGHIPTPGKVPAYELKTGRIRTLDFTV
ncbi:metallophosphoesterase family protein [Candidatus Micrarchaeota archaeon]|nr:metallophosphoesterase family protein [Candidatus Micrarchaeota archaeon]